MNRDFLISGNPQNIPNARGPEVMFYTATKEQVEQLHPDIARTEPNKIRFIYTHEDGTKRLVDRVLDHYFSDKPWGLETEYLTEGLFQAFVDDVDYLSLSVRNTIKAPDGWTFVSCDYSGQELRLGAINTKSRVFLKAFLEGKDVHLQTAITMFGEAPVLENKKRYRTIAKGANFGLQYGGSWRVLLNQYTSEDEAKAQYDAYNLAMADHFAVQNAQVKKTRETHTEYSMFGLPVRLHNYYRSDSWSKVSQGERLARNHRIQATGADVMSIAFIRLWKEIFSKITNAENYIRFQLTVHDEIDFLIKNEVIHTLVPLILKHMQVKMPDWEIPLTVGLSMGPTFGAQYEYKYDQESFKIIGPDMSAVEHVDEAEEKQEEIKVEEVKEEITLSF